MMKLLVQLGLVISCVILFSGCSNDGSLPAEVERDATFDPLPQGLPVFIDIDEAFIADSLEDDSRFALFSYQLPETPQDAPAIKEIFSADNRVIVSLNTEDDRFGRSEVTMLVRNDSVYSINHLTNQIRLLSHFTNKVCELIPRERVETSPGQSADKRLTVLHDELVYVMTVEGSGTNACAGNGKKRFYALPLDHQLDPTLSEDDQLNSLELVNESLARAKLMFAWEDNPQQAGEQILTYGFLGYGLEEPNSASKKPALVLYDEQREVIWRQERTIETFPVVQVTPEKASPAYLFDVQALEDQYYLIQLGLDVFVVESSVALFSKAFNETENILNDRTLKLSPGLKQPLTEEGEAIAFAVPAKILFDEDDLLVIDGSKVFYQAYQTPPLIRNPSETYEFISQNPTNIASRKFTETRYFSQFDLKDCANDPLCVAAHDAAAQAWQFIIPCDADLGCALNDQVANFCETADEKRITNSTEPLCVASDYRHLSELNTPANDMVFKGFMQYANDYARSLDFVLENNLLYITARMHEKELLLRYNYTLDFSAPKLQREQVLFGRQSRLFGLDAHFVANNLFLTALSEAAVRSNECYKNYQKVDCDLGQVVENGSTNSCTGKDLNEGLCANQFQEYESQALFCSSIQLQDLSCSDANSTLAIESSSQDAKWMNLYDYSSGLSAGNKMHLLIGDSEQALAEQKLDEGRLLNPEIFDVDPDSGQPLVNLGVLEGTVEQALSNGWVVKSPEPNEVEVLAHLNVISEDVIPSTSAQPESRLVKFLLEQTFLDESSITADTIHSQIVGQSVFDRP